MPVTRTSDKQVVAATDAVQNMHPALAMTLTIAKEAAGATSASLIEVDSANDITSGVPLGVDELALVFASARPQELGILDACARLVRQGYTWSRLAAGGEGTSGRLRRGNFIQWLGEKMATAIDRDGTLTLLIIELEDHDPVSQLYGSGDFAQLVPTLYNAVEQAVRGVDSVYRCDERSLAVALPRCSRADARKVAERVREGLAQARDKGDAGPGLSAQIKTYAHPGELTAFGARVEEPDIVNGDTGSLLRLWAGFIAGAFDANVALFAAASEGLNMITSVGRGFPDEIPSAGSEALAANRSIVVPNDEEKDRDRLFAPLVEASKPTGIMMLEAAKGRFGPAELEVVRRIGRRIGPLMTQPEIESDQPSFRARPLKKEFRFNYDGIIGRSPAMSELFEVLERVIETEYPVIIQGESGSGKELIARAIHFNGPRRANPLIAENCAALNENLLEAELFGYEKGSFTGAETSRKGLFQLADGGTLFLDEIADMGSSMQKDLLRILQEGVVRPVGGKQYLKVDVRVICAANRDLEKLVAQNEFRSDLFYRLNVWNLRLPPLRDRREDIPLLVECFLEKIANQTGTPKKSLGAGVLDALIEHDWPGNIRELKNEIARMVALSTGDDIVRRDFSKRPSAETEQLTTSSGHEIMPLAALEKGHILKTLRYTNGNRAKAAELLGINKATIYRKLKQYGFEG